MITNTFDIKEVENLNPDLVAAIKTGKLEKVRELEERNIYDLNAYYVTRKASHVGDTSTKSYFTWETDKLGLIHLATSSSPEVFDYVFSIIGLDVNLKYTYEKETTVDTFDDTGMSHLRSTHTGKVSSSEDKVERSLSPAEYAIYLGKYDRAAALFAKGSTIDRQQVMFVVKYGTTVDQALDFVRVQLPDNAAIRSAFDNATRKPSPPVSPPASAAAPR